MNCEKLREHYDLFALDIAEEPERGEIRDHLDRACDVCMAGVRRSLETAALIGAARLRPSLLPTSPPYLGLRWEGGAPLAAMSWWAPALAMPALDNRCVLCYQ